MPVIGIPQNFGVWGGEGGGGGGFSRNLGLLPGAHPTGQALEGGGGGGLQVGALAGEHARGGGERALQRPQLVRQLKVVQRHHLARPVYLYFSLFLAP